MISESAAIVNVWRWRVNQYTLGHVDVEGALRREAHMINAFVIISACNEKTTAAP